MTPRSRRVTSPGSGRGALGLLLAAVLGALVPAAVGLAAAPAAEAATCGPAPAGKVAVVVVIDTGSGTPAQRCVTVPERSSGLDALRSTGVSLRIGPGGFVCGVGGTPSEGCATDDPSAPSWSYWHASPGGTWAFAQVGAGGYRVPRRCAVEGWSFGPPSSKRPPQVAPPAVTCEAVPRPPVTAPPATAAPSVPPAGASGGGAQPAPGVGNPSGEGPSGDPGAASGDDPEGPDGDAPAGEATTTTVDGAVSPPEDEQPDPDAEVSDDPEDRAERASAPEGAAGLQTAEEAAASGGGSWVGAGVLVGVVALVAGGAVLRNRRR